MSWRLISIIYMLAASLFITVEFTWSEETIVENLDTLINEALKNNPQIQVAYNNWQAAEYKIKEVKSLPDPKASYAYFGQNAETRVGPQEHKYGISQKVPFPGKLKNKGRAQKKRTDILAEKYEGIKREVIKNLKFAYCDIFWVDKATQITEEEKAILEGLEKVAQRRYESNLTPQQDVIKVQVDLSKLIDKLFLLQQNRRSLAAKMNSILNRPKGQELGSVSVEPEDFQYGLDQLHKIAKGASQKLQAASLDIERAKYEKSLAKLNYFPDFTFGFDYIQVGGGTSTRPNDGEDAWMGKIMVNVPIWFGKLQAQLEEKEAKLTASKKNYENLENSVVFEIEDLYFKITTYKDIISLYRTALLPQTEQSFQAAKTAYETGSVDFLNWLDAERVLLQTRLAYYKAIVDYQKSLAYLERVIGRDL